VYETYLHHFDIDPVLQNEVDQTLTKCGRVRGLLREAGPDRSYYYNDLSEEILNNRVNRLAEISVIMGSLQLELLYNFPLYIHDDLFMEVLLNNLRNEITSYQAFIEKFKTREFKLLSDRLSNENDCDLRDVLEDKLSGLNEIRIRDRILHSSIYDVVNNEKMTPQFLKLAKISKNTGSLKSLKDKNGNPFPVGEAYKNHVITEYAEIYGNPGPASMVEDIFNFLGPDIANHEIVTRSKLSENVKLELESDLTLSELDRAMSTAKLSSAGGMDGFNNRTLKRLWGVLRIPLCNYSKRITDTGMLTESFKTASIKLIPKKGDLTNLKNWRPISLLNCIYKIILRAVNNRLQEVAP
jgi:hypothetical protein